MKGRGVSLRNLRMELNSNENIFKQEDYKMKLSLSFPETDEQNCKKSLFMRHLTIIKYMITFSAFRHLYLLIFWWSYYGALLSLFRIVFLFILLLGGLMLAKIDRFIFFLPFLRMGVEFDNIANILFSCYLTPDNEVFTFAFILIQFIYGMFYNLFFALTINESLLYYAFEGLLMLSFSGHQETYCIVRLCRNFFSLRLLCLIGILVIIIIFQYGYSRKLRQFWALYDSFKKSYFTMKCIYDDFPNPVFVLQKKDMQICYKNRAGERIFEKYRNPNTPEIKFSKTKFDFDFQLKDFVNIRLFENEVTKCLKGGCNSFDFPLMATINFFETKENENFFTLFEGNLGSADWVKVFVFSCEWKQVESVMIQMVESSYLHKNNLYQLEVLEIINNQLKEISNNINYICFKAPQPVKETAKVFKSPLLSCSSSNKSPLIPSRNKLDPNPGMLYNNLKDKKENKPIHLNYFNQISGRGKGKADGASSPTKKRLAVVNNSKAISPLTNATHLYVSPYLNQTNMNESSTITSFDYTLLYFGHLHFNSLYDMFISLEVFNTLKNGKFISKIEKINIEGFLNYFINYLTPFATSKGYKIELVSNDLNEEDIEINYIYFRVLLYNILMFIMNNTGDVDENKKLDIKIEHSTFGQNFTFYKMILIFNESESLIDYSQISRLVECLKKYTIKDLDLNKFKSLNFGLIVAYYICNFIFSEPNSRNNFLIKQTNKTKQITTSFYIPPKGEKVMQEKEFKNFECSYSKKAYERIIDKVYLRGVNRDERQKKRGAYDYGRDDQFNIEEDKGISLSADKTLSNDIAIPLKTICIWNKVITREAHLEQIQKANLKISVNEAKANKTPLQIFGWENKKTIKYCPLPRFLIVEDNFYGRLGVVDELKKMSFKYSIDVASDGADAVDKFKILLNKGYIFDFIFMDIVLIEMDGTEATRIIRDFEREYHVHTNIVSISVERQANFEEGLFDENFEKPINNCKLFKECIFNHLKNFRPDIKR